MDDLQFHTQADATLTQIEETIEQEDGTVDVELLEGVMTITLADHSKIVINKHLPTKQLWMASSKHGASHWKFDEQKHIWVSDAGVGFIKTLSEQIGITFEN